MRETLLDSLSHAWATFQAKLLYLFPRLLAALLLFAAGWVVAIIVRTICRRVLRLWKFDARCERSGMALILRRGELHHPPSDLLAGLAYWVVLVSAAVFSLNALELPLLDRLIAEFFLYLPRVAAALVVLTAGYLLANFTARAALLLAVNEELPSPRLISSGVRFLVLVLACAMALEQLGIAQNTVTLAFGIAFGALMLALALAFGLGGQALAQELLARSLKDSSLHGPGDRGQL